MTDLCAEDGIKARYEYLNSSNPFTESFKSFNIEKDKGDIKDHEKLCNDGFNHYTTYLKKIMTECPNHSYDIDKFYYSAKFQKVYICSRDSVTGVYCAYANVGDFLKPYSQWDPSECLSSCLIEYDAVYREYGQSPACDTLTYEDPYYSFRGCKNYESGGNPTCGKINLAEINQNSSDATILTSPVALFPLIIFILFAIFK